MTEINFAQRYGPFLLQRSLGRHPDDNRDTAVSTAHGRRRVIAYAFDKRRPRADGQSALSRSHRRQSFSEYSFSPLLQPQLSEIVTVSPCALQWRTHPREDVLLYDDPVLVTEAFQFGLDC